MDSDGPLKLLFRKYARDLLPLTGDAGSKVKRAGPVEIQALKRRVDWMPRRSFRGVDLASWRACR